MTNHSPLADVRNEIDSIDEALVNLLAQRQACIVRAVAIKEKEGLPPRIPERVEDVLEKVRKAAVSSGCSPEKAEKIWNTIIEQSIAFEEEKLGSS